MLEQPRSIRITCSIDWKPAARAERLLEVPDSGAGSSSHSDSKHPLKRHRSIRADLWVSVDCIKSVLRLEFFLATTRNGG